MFLDLGWSEILLIGVIALVVIGPKDLPKAMRVAGYWIRKARSMSHEFQMNVERMMHEAELDEVRQELKKAAEIDIREKVRNTVDADGSLAESVKAPELPDFSVDEQPPPGRADVETPPAGAQSEPQAAADAAQQPAKTDPPQDGAAAPEAERQAPAEPPPPAASTARDAAQDVAPPKP